ncbi:hypothetical protein ACFPVX_24145 [Cohnella faecalis]|nr:hypothetical protein [Cohnella faecalis]
MRQLLMTVMLIVTVVLIYNGTVRGDGGTGKRIQSSGDRMSDRVSRISP